jgi:hypothetical protein
MKFDVAADHLTVTLQGMEIFFGLRRRLTIPRANIVNLEWQADSGLEGRLWRLAGTDIPTVLYAGYFRGNGQKYYLYLQNPRGLTWLSTPIITQNTLLITTWDFPYKQILLTCQPDIGASLVNWWRNKN